MSSTSLLDTPDEMSMFANSVHPSFLSDDADRNLLFTPAALQEKMNRLTREGQRGPAVAGSLVAFAFTLNYIFGAGVLSLPYTISKAGVIGSAVFMIFTAFLSGMSMIWLTEVCGRAEALTRADEEEKLNEDSPGSTYLNYIADRPENSGASLFRISSRRLEINQISTLILGAWPGRIYSASVCFYSLGSMWFYAVIFGRSLTETLPLSFLVKKGDHCDLSTPLYMTTSACHQTYTVYLGVFLVLTMFASLFELADQKKLQTGLSALAMACIFIMITSLIVEAVQHPYIPSSHNSSLPSSLSSSLRSSSHLQTQLNGEYQPPVIGISIANFGGAFMNFVFAFMAHAGVPGLVQLMNDKKAAPKTFLGAMLTACLIYLCLGTIAALYFGVGPDGIKSLITLDWFNYNGSANPNSAGDIFTKGLSYLVRLYPCVSVTSAFVLYADTLASSMRVLFFENPDRQIIKVLGRWIIIWLSIAGAAFMIKIDVIVGFCGLAGVNLVMIYPALLQIYSKKICNEKFHRSLTPFSWHFSANVYAYFMLFFSVVTSGLGVYSLVKTIRDSSSGSGSLAPAPSF